MSSPAATSPRRSLEPPAQPQREATPPAQVNAPTNELDEMTAQLAAMFPTLERDTIQDVLTSQNGNAEEAVPLLLVLSGEGQSDEDSTRQQQLHGDELLARQLASADEHNYQNLAYQPRVSRNSSRQQDPRYASYDPQRQQQQQREDDGPDELDNVINTVKSAAEQAKVVGTNAALQAKSFGLSVFKQIQTKIKELDNKNPQVENGQTNQNYPASNTASSSSYNPSTSSSIPSASSGPPRVGASLPYASRYGRPNNPSSPSSRSDKSRDAKESAAMSFNGDTPRSETPPVPAPTAGKRISLLAQPNADNKKTVDSDDEDELDYVRNPFEDRD